MPYIRHMKYAEKPTLFGKIIITTLLAIIIIQLVIFVWKLNS